MHEVNEEELSKCISTFKNEKAPDESKITIEHLKYGGNLTVIILTKLVNLIFQNAAIPNTWKSGIGCLILKTEVNRRKVQIPTAASLLQVLLGRS